VKSQSFPAESVAVRGTLVQGRTLAAARERLSLRAALQPSAPAVPEADEVSTVALSNLCAAPLPFEVRNGPCTHLPPIFIYSCIFVLLFHVPLTLHPPSSRKQRISLSSGNAVGAPSAPRI